MGAIEAYHNNTGSQHQARFDTLLKEGFRLISLSCYGDEDSPRYAAVWEKKAGPAWRGVHGLSAAQYQSTFNDLKGKGFLPVIITATGSGAGARFAGVFTKNNPPTLTRFGLRQTRDWGEPDDLLFDYWNGIAQKNDMTLVWLSSYGGTDLGERRYAAIWQKLTPKGFFDVSMGESVQTYQQAFDFWTHQNVDSNGVAHSPRTPLAVAVNTDGPLYSAVWLDGNPWGKWTAVHGLTSQGYQHKFDDLRASGYHPVRVQGGGGEGGDIRFAAIFAK
jgi:hypothetical protein